MLPETPTLRLIDGRSMPQLGLGVWKVPDDHAADVVGEALKAGYGLIDTAAIYGNEAGVGQALRRSGISRQQVFLTTKVWNDHQGYDAAFRALDASLERLGQEFVDLYLIHWPTPARGLYVETWRALIKMRAEGRVRSIGVSNFNADHLRTLMDETGVVPCINQVELHPRFQQRALRAFHAEHGIVTESWAPLGRAQFLQHPALQPIAAKHAKTAAQVVLRWHLDSGLAAIPKSADPARIRQNIDILDFSLDATDMAAIAAMDDPGGRTGGDPLTFG